MATITVASKANQATTFPALLVASYLKEVDPKSEVTVYFEEIETLQSQKDATVELSLFDNKPTYGSEEVIQQLLKAYPILQAKSHDHVCRITIERVCLIPL